MSTIPLRVALRALAYVLSGRAEWMSRKARTYKAPEGDTKGIGRVVYGQEAGRRARAVSDMAHSHVCGTEIIDVRTAGLMLAYAVGHVEVLAELNQSLGAMTGQAAAVMARLVELGVLPAARVVDAADAAAAEPAHMPQLRVIGGIVGILRAQGRMQAKGQTFTERDFISLGDRLSAAHLGLCKLLTEGGHE